MSTVHRNKRQRPPYHAAEQRGLRRFSLINERVDDIPVLQAQMQHMGLPSLLDELFPTHGNWQGLSLGWVATIWLTHILSRGDHRLS